MALATFETLSASKFTLNGAELFKFYNVLALSSDSVRIVNIYDADQELYRAINVADIEIDGTTYTNSADVITNLSPIIYAPLTSGSINQTQLDANTAAINNLPNVYAPLVHNHNSLYYLKSEVDGLIANLPSGTAIDSGAVVGSNIIFYDDTQNELFRVDARPFLQQANNLVYNPLTNVLTLQNVFGQTLSQITLNTGSGTQSFYDSFTFKGQLASQSDLNSVTVVSNFEVYEVNNTGVYYLLVKDTTPEDLVNSRVYISHLNEFFDFNFSIGINGVNYTAYLLDSQTINGFDLNLQYTFNVWFARTGASTGTGGNPPVEAIYDYIADMLADQANQKISEDYLVLDASADPNVTSGAAYYALTQKTGVLADDYILTNPVEVAPATDFKKWQVNEGFDAGDQTIIRSFGNKLYLLLARASFFRTTDIVAETAAFQWEVILDGDAGGGGGGISDGDKGDITVSNSGADWTIDNSAVTLAKIQDLNAHSIIARDGAGQGVSSQLSFGNDTVLARVGSGNIAAVKVTESLLDTGIKDKINTATPSPPTTGTFTVDMTKNNDYTGAVSDREVMDIAASPVVGVVSTVLFNTTTEPVVTGATKIETRSDDFIANTDMIMVIWVTAQRVNYLISENV